MTDGASSISNHEPALELLGFGEPRVLRAGEVLSFPTQHAAKALFSLALSPDGHLDISDLGERLWPDAPLSRLSSRIATMTWQLRRSLGDDGWRVTRVPSQLSLDLTDLEVDVLTTRREASGVLASIGRAGSPVSAGADRSALLATLETPLLTPWADEAWVVSERLINKAMASSLTA